MKADSIIKIGIEHNKRRAGWTQEGGRIDISYLRKFESKNTIRIKARWIFRHVEGRISLSRGEREMEMETESGKSV